MKWYKLLVLLFLGMNGLLFGQDQSPEEIEWKLIEHKNYAIQHPSNWSINESAAPGIELMIRSEKQGKEDVFLENVNLIIQDLSGYNLDLKAFTELSINQVSTYFTDAEVLLSETIEGAQYDYQKLIYVGKQGLMHMQFEQYFWVIDNEAYILTLTCDILEFKNYRAVGERIMDSFKIKKINKAPGKE